MPDQYTLWSYDTNTSNWDQYDVRDDAPLRVNSGASAEAPDLGLAFVFVSRFHCITQRLHDFWSFVNEYLTNVERTLRLMTKSVAFTSDH